MDWIKSSSAAASCCYAGYCLIQYILLLCMVLSDTTHPVTMCYTVWYNTPCFYALYSLIQCILLLCAILSDPIILLLCATLSDTTHLVTMPYTIWYNTFNTFCYYELHCLIQSILLLCPMLSDTSHVTVHFTAVIPTYFVSTSARTTAVFACTRSSQSIFQNRRKRAHKTPLPAEELLTAGDFWRSKRQFSLRMKSMY